MEHFYLMGIFFWVKAKGAMSAVILAAISPFQMVNFCKDFKSFFGKIEIF